MIGKIVLGESWNFLIGKLKLSYRKVSTIIGESLAAMRSELRRGCWDWIFIAESAIKSRFFALFSFCIHTKTRHSSLWGTKNSYPLGFFSYRVCRGCVVTLGQNWPKVEHFVGCGGVFFCLSP